MPGARIGQHRGMTTHVPEIEPLPPELASPSGDTPETRSDWSPRSIVGRAGRGAIVGALATVPMTAVQLLGLAEQRREPSFTEVTRRFTRKLPGVPTPRHEALGITAAARARRVR